MAALHSQGLWGLVPPMTSLDQGLQGSAHCHQRATWVFQDCGCTGLMAAPLCQEVGVVTRRHCFYIWMCHTLLSLIADVDECLLGITTCALASNGTCINTLGSYNCSCNPGYSGDGRNCVDIDECVYYNESFSGFNCQGRGNVGRSLIHC